MFFRRRKPPTIAHAPPIARRVTELSAGEFVAERAGYADDPELTRFRMAREAAFRAATDLRAFKNPALDRLIDTVDAAGRPCHVLDIDGALGSFGAALIAQRGNMVASFTVLELPEIVAGARALGEGAAHFIDRLDDIPARPDIVFTSGTLQYFDEPFDLVRTILDLAAPAVILARTFLAEDRPRYFRQDSPMFDHGAGPIPPGFENRLVASYAQAVPWPALRAAITRDYAITRGAANDSGVIVAADDLFGFDLVLRRLNPGDPHNAPS